ncbi:hypothetical protein N9937_00850 [bacterium]|nr:hypothetical protein [bacterium]
MSNVWFTSDWHFGHKNILKYRPDFESREVLEDLILENYKRLVTKRDKVYFLGDIAFTDEALEKIAGLQGNKVLVLGNHDTDAKTRPSIQAFAEVFNEIHGMVKHKGFWITHCPMHPEELRGKKNIHGHTHDFVLSDPRYLNVCLEQINYGLIDLNAVKAIFQGREDETV